MTVHASDFMVVLCNQLTTCQSIRKLSTKNALTLFNILTPSYIVSIDNEITANPYILSEAMSLLEIASQLGAFYGYDFVGEVQKTIIRSRTAWRGGDENQFTQTDSQEGCTQQDLMQDYFVANVTDIAYFLRKNPVFLGIYIHVYLSAVSME